MTIIFESELFIDVNIGIVNVKHAIHVHKTSLLTITLWHVSTLHYFFFYLVLYRTLIVGALNTKQAYNTDNGL